MIQATQTHAHYQKYRKFQQSGEVPEILVFIERNQQATGAFDDYQVGASCERDVSVADPLQGDRFASQFGG